jgi:hypothetical protein
VIGQAENESLVLQGTSFVCLTALVGNYDVARAPAGAADRNPLPPQRLASSSTRPGPFAISRSMAQFRAKICFSELRKAGQSEESCPLELKVACRLTAILYADVYDYRRIIADYEEAKLNVVPRPELCE